MARKRKVDRFSSLTEGVAHHILSFVTITDLARFSCVSKRCRELSLSTPSLGFDKFSHTNTGSCDKRLRLLDSLHRFFDLREDNKIDKFRICWSSLSRHSETPCFCDHNEKARMISWIECALRCKVEVLHLEIDIDDVTPFVLPSSVFVSSSLRSLSVSLWYSAIIKVPIPSFSCLEYLNMDLRHANIDEGFFKWISSSCKCIKELRMSYHGGKLRDITIESSSLKSFTIEDAHGLHNLTISGKNLEDIRIWWSTRRCRSLNVTAPNLKYLEWIGHMYELKPQLGGLLCWKRTLTQYMSFFNLFEGGLLPAPFEDVSHLQLDLGNFSNELVPRVVLLFRGMRNLSTLYIKTDQVEYYLLKAACSKFGTAYWESRNLPFISQLEEVTVEICKDSRGSNLINFLTFILEDAENLKRMVIVHSPQCAKSSLNKLTTSAKSSNAKVFFEVREF
ncbi:F-box/LRR-repeat protein [Pyrus ussuriensis x Pyrus communis]|uniref:F-box/LRR-repeat protein n=1 Tax=Pyrus ussuriensis x Pyrus communis TaxID=2448454 RepID=A0A5N5HR66_9ROSA|nr:F-box/LRR-repeat protein [Pyrus ussuriensis x Pyrus communis]